MFATSFVVFKVDFVVAEFVLGLIDLVAETIYFCFVYEEAYMQPMRENCIKPYVPKELQELM